MSRNILDLPTEVLDHIFEYLPLEDQKNARQVCRQFNQQLSSPRYYKNTKLRFERGVRYLINDDLLRAAGQGKIHCIELIEWDSTASEEEIDDMVQLFEASRFSLETLSLCCCSELNMTAIFRALGNMLRLRHLSVVCGSIDGSTPRVPSITSESVGFTLITKLELTLISESSVELVCSLASHLECLVLNVRCKDLLVRCLNEPHLAIHSLTVYDVHMIDIIDPGELGGECWRMLSKLETLRCTSNTSLYYVLPEMLQHCRNLTCLAFEHCRLSIQCVQQIDTLKGLKDLCLYRVESDGSSNDPLPILDLPNLESMTLSTEVNIRLSKQTPRLTSVVIEADRMLSCPKAILSEIIKIDGIGGRRLRRLQFKNVRLDREAINWLGSLSIDLLSFEDCRIDGSILDALATSETGRKICRIEMVNCALTFQAGKQYMVRTVAELRAMCPYLQITDTMIPHEGVYRSNSANYSLLQKWVHENIFFD
uniref:F-box domain-containing protein n=1 Tax=Anopheles atroparvus TaxID=41427 RepID=A0AAG5DJI8_ANOAO